jgi:ribosomal protein S6
MKYEFMGILKPFLPEDVRVKLQENIKKRIVEAGGSVTEEDIWGKRHLAYKIKGHEEGFPKGKLDEIISELRTENDLLRYMFVKADV